MESQPQNTELLFSSISKDIRPFQDFEDDFPWKVDLKILNYFFPAYLKILGHFRILRPTFDGKLASKY